MKISLNNQEAKAFVNIACAVESNIEELKELVKDNKVITFDIHSNGSVDIDINSDYTVEFLSVYQKYIGLAVDQLKALYKTITLFQQEAEEVISKYALEDKEEVDDKSDPSENTGNFY